MNDNHVHIYISVVTSLLGIAYPLLLQVIAQLEEKYTSENVVILFDKELEKNVFKYLLYFSLGFIALWTLQLKPIEIFEDFNFICNSAVILVVFSTIALVIAFFCFIRKILIYYTPTKFIEYLIKKHSKSKSKQRYFEVLSNMLLYSIKSQQTNLSLKLSEFFYTAFMVEREKKQNIPVVYPDLYYKIVYDSIEELAVLKDKKNYALEYRIAGGLWLLGELRGGEISKETYSWLWRNILIITRHEQEDMMFYYWKTVSQYYKYSLRPIYADYDYSNKISQIKNKDEVEKRKFERKKFIEFHYALGGLLLYKQMYNCIKRLFSYTMSEPPDYELLPETMDEIFNHYFTIMNPYDMEYLFISSKYPFSEQYSLDMDGVIKKWISSYMAILFLRQYTITPCSIVPRPLDYPNISSLKQKEIIIWIDTIDSFKKVVLEHLNDKNLFEKLNLSFVTGDWCKENNKIHPKDFFDEFKKQLQNKHSINIQNLPLSEYKIAKFNESTKQIIEEIFNDYSALKNPDITEENSDKWFVNGQRMLENREAFLEDSGVCYADFDSIAAYSLLENLKESIAYTFLLKKSKTYLLEPKNIFRAIDKLGIDDKFLIINFGVNLDFFNHLDLKVQFLTKEKYRNIPIINYSGTMYFNPSFFILRRDDLPNIIQIEIPSHIIEKYSPEKISDKLNLYTSVIDINKNKKIFDEYKQNKVDDELMRSVLLSIIISTEIRWKKKIEMIQITQHSEYWQSNGIPNNLNEIEPI